MTIPYCVQLGDSLDKTQIETVREIILGAFDEIDTTYNYWNPHSELSLLNQAQAYEKIEISSSLAHFLSYVGAIVQKTEGRFDPTVQPVQQAWKKCLMASCLPEPSVLEPLVQAAGWHHVHLEANLFWKDDALTALDLSGIAKGYAVDLIAERLSAAGFTQIYVEWGGEIRTIGQHPEGRPWKVGIQGLYPISLQDSSVATSGTYIQSWSVGGANYTHIIDPRSWQPLADCPISSVTVIAPTCAEADALATALMLFPSIEAAHTWASEHAIQAFIW